MRQYLSAIALAVFVTAPTIAQARIACADRTSVVERLEAKYGESFSGGGLQNASSVFEIWSSDEAGTWTILMTRPDGTTCVMASGTNWREGPIVSVKKGIKG